jgi:hypothetical protein
MRQRNAAMDGLKKEMFTNSVLFRTHGGKRGGAQLHEEIYDVDYGFMDVAQPGQLLRDQP